ncbi:MAG: hypothetical protein GX591_01835 [Planctomycetes bacterium]|nr:hypothetical protein [Planctomycetota bacterium]
MRIAPYIMAGVVFATVLGSGSVVPAWLCVRADGVVGIKTSGAGDCRAACFGEPGEHGRDVAQVAVSQPEDCCLDIPIGLNNPHQPVEPMRLRTQDHSASPLLSAGLCKEPATLMPEGGLPTPFHVADSPPWPSPVRTVVLLI